MFTKIKRLREIIKGKGRFAFLNDISSKLLEVPLYPLAIRKIRKFKSGNLEEIFDFSWNLYFGLIRPVQIKEEFMELLKIFYGKNPKIFLEIGSQQGGTLFLFCRAAQSDAKIISIDLPLGEFGVGYHKRRSSLYHAFKKEKQQLYFLKKDSHQDETLEEVKKILDGQQLDFLFIDGDHSYEGVKKDFEMYAPLVKTGGVVAFHDIGLYPPESGYGVKKYWDGIKSQYKTAEIVFGKKGLGIGVLYK